MHAAYEDIMCRIEEMPLWYDQNGTPRYEAFDPHLCPNIYTHQVVLLRIACQACGRQFDVEMHAAGFFEELHPKKLHYGDPPRHDDNGNGYPCAAGNSMNCEDLAVLQVWYRPGGKWERHPELEGIIE